jgi:hypothetical protein
LGLFCKECQIILNP